MVRAKIWLLVVVCGIVVSNGWGESAAKSRAERWEKDIAKFEDWDSKNSHVPDAVLFVGSSSIRMWRTRDCFGDLPVINRGFGGSHISDVNYFADRIVLRYAPKVIVFYAGDNDIAAGKTPQRVLEDFQAFRKIVRAKLPGTRIIFITIKACRSRWSLWPQAKKANLMIKDFCEKDNRLFYVDAAATLLGNDGQPDPDLFLADQLHLNAKGYEKWTKLLGPVIQNALKSRRARGRSSSD